MLWDVNMELCWGNVNIFGHIYIYIFIWMCIYIHLCLWMCICASLIWKTSPASLLYRDDRDLIIDGRARSCYSKHFSNFEDVPISTHCMLLTFEFVTGSRKHVDTRFDHPFACNSMVGFDKTLQAAGQCRTLACRRPWRHCGISG